MSSHHFVKEGQEPALVIAADIGYGRVSPLLEWAPYVIVFAETLDTVLTWGIKTDLVLTSKQLEQSTIEKTKDQQPLKVITTDNVWMEVMTQLVARNQFFANICVDKAMNFFDKLRHQQVEVSLIDQEVRWSFIPSGMFKKWYPMGAVCFLHARDLQKTDNLVKSARNAYKVKSDGLITIECKDSFWLGEPLI